MTTKEIWNKVHSLYSNEPPLTTIHVDQRNKEDHQETRKEETLNPSNEDQSNPKEDLDEIAKMRNENEMLKEQLQNHKK